MRRLTALLLFVTLPLAGAAAQEAPAADFAGYISRAVETVIVPEFAEVDAAAADLSADLTALCAAPTAEIFATVGDAFERIVIAWAHVMSLPIEPLLVNDRRDRFFFWPDPRGVTLRQIQPVIADRDESVTDAANLAGKSVALQGLGALDYVLYGTGAESILAADEDGVFRCRYAMAIGQSLADIAAELADEIGPSGSFTELMLHPGPDNPLYPTLDSAVIDLIIAAEDIVEMARGSFLLPVLGQTIDLARPRIAPLWRSGLSTVFLTAMIDGSHALLFDADAAAMLSADTQWIVDSMAWEFMSIAEATPPADASIELAATDDDFRQLLFRIVAYTDNLKSLIGTSLPGTIGLAGAFFANEG
jgi:uncharacterized protein